MGDAAQAVGSNEAGGFIARVLAVGNGQVNIGRNGHAKAVGDGVKESVQVFGAAHEIGLEHFGADIADLRA